MEQTLSSAPAAPITAKAKISPTMVLIKNAWEIYKKRLLPFIEIGLVPLLGAVLVGVIIALFYLGPLIKDQNAMLILYIFLAVLGLISIIFTIYIALAAQAGFILMLKYPALKIGEAFKAGRQYAWLLGIVQLMASFLIILWSILFIIPGIIFALYYSQVHFVLINEDKKGMSALKRSKELVKNYWWPVAGRGLLLGLIAWIGLVILSWPLQAMRDNAIIYQLWYIVIGVIRFLFGQFWIIFSYLIFKDLQKIKAQ